MEGLEDSESMGLGNVSGRAIAVEGQKRSRIIVSGVLLRPRGIFK